MSKLTIKDVDYFDADVQNCIFIGIDDLRLGRIANTEDTDVILRELFVCDLSLLTNRQIKAINKKAFDQKKTTK
jgi:hypothetical protein